MDKHSKYAWNTQYILTQSLRVVLYVYEIISSGHEKLQFFFVFFFFVFSFFPFLF